MELLFADSPERMAGRELWHNGRSVTVDYDTLDPLVRRDSYQDLASMDPAEFHHLDVRHDRLSEQVKTSSGDRALLSPPTTISPSRSERAPSPSSDSGLSVASQAGLGPDRGAALDKSPPRLDFEIAPPLLEVMAELAAQGRGGELPAGTSQLLGGPVNGDGSPGGKETDVLDGDERQAARSRSGPAGPRPGLRRTRSVSSEDVPESETENSTHRWVRQQQMVDVAAESYPEVDGGRRVGEAGGKTLPRAPSRGPAAQRRLWDTQPTGGDGGGSSNGDGNAHGSASQDEDLAALTTDVDESIEQLNLLILDLDPTFVPVPPSSSPMSRSASLRSNYLSQKGNAHLSDWSWQKQVSDVGDYAALPSLPSTPGSSSPLYQRSFSPHQGQTGGSKVVPSTPAFPVSPPTPYESRSFLKGLNSSGSSLTEGELFRPDVLASPASRQGVFGSMCSMSSDSPLPHTPSSTPDVCHGQTPNSQRSLHASPSPLSTPSAHSSPPRGSDGGPGSQRGPGGADLSSLLLGNGGGGLEHSLLEAVESLESLESLNLRGHGGLPPLLPEKRRPAEGPAELGGSRSPSLSGFSSPNSGSSLSLITFSSTPDHLRGAGGAWSPGADVGGKQQDTVKFVQDTSKYWYKSDISRDQAVAVLKDKEPGSFIVRDSHSFRGAYGLAVTVATPPPSVLQHSSKKGDLSNELVRHFLIECTQKGVRLKGCPNEPYFGSLTALVCQHSITPLALPCKLILPHKDPLEEKNESTAQTATNSAAELLKQGAACNVWYLGSVALESLTGHQAVQKATTQTISSAPPPPSTVVHFKVSAQGITLTDNQRKLFFRRHYAVNTVIFCSLDPQGRKWPQGSGSTAKIFGFVARKSQSDTENECHLFAEHDPEQPASAIVNFVSKVMIGSNKQK